MMRMRRSVSSPLAGISTCSGAPPNGASPALAGGMSCTCPSVSATMPARRARGMSASARSIAANSWVPSLPCSGTVMVRSSRSGRPPASCLDAWRGPPRPVRRGRRPPCSRSGRPPAGRYRAGSAGFPRPAAGRSATAAGRRRRGSARRAAGAAPGGDRERPARTAPARPPSSQTGKAGSKRSAAMACSICIAYCPSRSSIAGTCTWSPL